MSEKTVKSEVIAAKKGFAYRNIKKDFNEFKETPNITPNYHLELGEHYETQIVEDRADDWFEFQQIGVENVGVKNIIATLAKRGENPYDGRFAFKDEEALDTSAINPMDPESVKKLAESADAANAKLKTLAESVGLTVDELVDGMIKGNLQEVIDSKKTSEEVKEGE